MYLDSLDLQASVVFGKLGFQTLSEEDYLAMMRLHDLVYVKKTGVFSRMIKDISATDAVAKVTRIVCYVQTCLVFSIALSPWFCHPLNGFLRIDASLVCMADVQTHHSIAPS